MTKTPDRDLERLTDGVLGSYDSDDRTQRIGRTFLPSHDRIVAILGQVRQLLFPGYFGAQQLSGESVKYHVGNLLNRLAGELADEINHCLCAGRDCGECPDPAECMSQARAIAREFLARVPAIREMLALDAQAAYDGDPAAKSIDEVVYCYPGFYAITVYRVAHELWELGVPLMPRIMTECAHSLTGTDIHPGAKIGKSFFIDHATGVVVGETTVIGDNVKIYQGVTLGALSIPKDERGRAIKGHKRHPTIEDNVTIYANATILGGETVIGAGVTVGGNTFVTESIRAGTTVAHRARNLKVPADKD
ncbi:MAG TPA: serine O-acetyltransferase [Phycisphaerae bacterium]|nr:serine O-acetyltransferase [Phycisphaerae bacterium]